MLEQMVSFFVSWFVYPGVSWNLLLLGTGLAIVFGAIWLTCHWPPLFEKHWLWAVLVGSAFLSLAAITLVQIPLQVWAGEALLHFWSHGVLMSWLLLAGIPQVLVSGLVQEGAKMVPIVVWWWRSERSIDLRLGLAIGAVAGAGLGIFEAVWAHNSMFAAGWTWQAVQAGGPVALGGFWERFFATAFHIAVSALAGYGLARGKGWQFYLIASFLHTLINYGVILLQKGYLSIIQIEIYIAVIAVLLTAVVLWLRWRKPVAPAES
jgi:hypothetical protein